MAGGKLPLPRRIRDGTAGAMPRPARCVRDQVPISLQGRTRVRPFCSRMQRAEETGRL